MGGATPTAVFLMSLGGPRSEGEVEPYLRELFGDPAVLSVPLGPFRKPLARLIARRRASSSREKYRLIGGRSPLVEETSAQAGALQQVLGPDFCVIPAMRCGHPNIEEAVREALAAGAGRAIALPLYPQFARATTQSSLDELERCWPEDLPLARIRTFHADSGYLDASAACVREALERVPQSERDRVLVVFSAHGLPMSQVKKGDPYPGEVEASVKKIAERAGITDYRITYQSRVGPVKWLGPDTIEFLGQQSGGRSIVAVPISLVSEHLETLYDLDILAARAAKKGGATAFCRVPALGTRPDFVAALASLVRKAAEP
jgi:ferrochelatase